MRLLERDAFGMLTRVIDPAQPITVIDVGAHVGDTVARALGEFPNATIHALEPSPQVYPVLERRAAELGRVKPHRLAAGDRSGTAELRLTGDPLFTSTLEPKPQTHDYLGGRVASAGRATVSLTTLDELAVFAGIDRAEIIKIDVQGVELGVLRGAAGLLRSGTLGVICEAQLVAEYEGASTFAQIDAFLSGVGFGLHQIHDVWFHGTEEQVTCVDALWLRRDALSWLRHTPSRAFELGWAAAVDRAVRNQHARGARSLMIYGGGRHTLACQHVLGPVSHIIDDDPARAGTTFAGKPVITMDQAVRLGPDAVVLSSNCHEQTLWDKAVDLRDAGIRVVRVHSGPAAPFETSGAALADLSTDSTPWSTDRHAA
jgi:FkbM family methyltransferase